MAVKNEPMNPARSRHERFIRIEPVGLEGDLVVPPSAAGIVVFAHGSGSSRLSPRNRYVAEQLQHGGLATLLFDLLTREEEAVDARSGELRFNIDFLAQRLLSVAGWLKSQTETRNLRTGYFGASTGAGAALAAAAQQPHEVFAVVSRGGRPDLAASWLPVVLSPTLLIVGGEDHQVIELNEFALARLGVAGKRLDIIPSAGHLFAEPGALEQVAEHACRWFQQHL